MISTKKRFSAVNEIHVKSVFKKGFVEPSDEMSDEMIKPPEIDGCYKLL